MTEPKSLCYFVQPKVGKEPLHRPISKSLQKFDGTNAVRQHQPRWYSRALRKKDATTF